MPAPAYERHGRGKCLAALTRNDMQARESDYWVADTTDTRDRQIRLLFWNRHTAAE
jgi:hypothetical protein